MRTITEALEGRKMIETPLPNGDIRLSGIVDGLVKQFGVLKAQISDDVLAASVGIKGHSKPGGEHDVHLQDGGASILSFSDYCARHLIPTYPHTRR